MRKPAFCICKNKDADQLRGNSEADQRLCFRYSESTIPLLPKSEISSLKPFSVAVQPGLCRTWSETPKTGFLITRLIKFKVRGYDGVIPPNDAKYIPNSEDSPIRVYTFCPNLSVQKFRIITVLLLFYFYLLHF